MYVIMHICKSLLQYVSYNESFQYSIKHKTDSCKGKTYSIYSWEQVLVFQRAIAYPHRNWLMLQHPDPPPLNIHENTLIYKEGSKASYWTLCMTAAYPSVN